MAKTFARDEDGPVSLIAELTRLLSSLGLHWVLAPLFVFCPFHSNQCCRREEGDKEARPQEIIVSNWD